MNIRRLIRRRRAVSPILAAILLIGLAVAAGAVLFTVVMPLIDNPGGSLVFAEDTEITATNVHLVFLNEGIETAQVTNITIDGAEINDFVIFSVNKGQGAFKNYAGTYTGTYAIKVYFTLGGVEQTAIEIDLTV